jgi:DNA ligase-1
VGAFREFAELCRALEGTRGRLEKRALVAAYLKTLSEDELPHAVAFLNGHAFPVSDPRTLSVRWLPSAVAHADGASTPATLPAQGAPLTVGDVVSAFGAIADASGAGSRARREALLVELGNRASPLEREYLARIIGGEMRTGVSDGLVLEAIAASVDAAPDAARRAALFLGDLSAVAALARRGGAAALESAEPRLFVPMLPMLAEIAEDWDAVLGAHGGTTALEFKYDGARVQIHSDGARVAIWSRRLSDVTGSLPDVVSRARGCGAAPFILDGEVVALGADGKPLPFQELMRRFRRVHDVEEALGKMPLALHLFDCLLANGRPLNDAPYAERFEALTRVTGGRDLAERTLVRGAAEAETFRAAALAAGHEGVMAKDLRSAYAPGGRGKRWFKIKTPETVDCVIVAADRGSGRRAGWLSNYHLAVVDGESFADVGKTFKGFTDRQFTEMTGRLKALAVADDGYTVRVRPEIVVEVEYNEIQKSPTYPSGLALRFARIARVRDDKGPGQATTLAELRALYDAQFHRKARAE